MNNSAKATKKEIKEGNRRCWSTGCKNRAWLYDWMGWHHCLKHWWRSYRWGGGEVSLRSFIYELKHTKIG